MNRTFVVIVRHNKKNLGYPPVSGIEAIRTMRTLESRGFIVIAETTANGVTERLTLSELVDAVIVP